jgi:hypothetical protein
MPSESFFFIIASNKTIQSLTRSSMVLNLFFFMFVEAASSDTPLPS